MHYTYKLSDSFFEDDLHRLKTSSANNIILEMFVMLRRCFSRRERLCLLSKQMQLNSTVAIYFSFENLKINTYVPLDKE